MDQLEMIVALEAARADIKRMNTDIKTMKARINELQQSLEKLQRSIPPGAGGRPTDSAQLNGVRDEH